MVGATRKMAQLLVPKHLCWLCLEQEVVTGGWLGRSSGVQGYQNLDPAWLQYECKIWNCHLALMLRVVVSEDTTKSQNSINSAVWQRYSDQNWVSHNTSSITKIVLPVSLE